MTKKKIRIRTKVKEVDGLMIGVPENEVDDVRAEMAQHSPFHNHDDTDDDGLGMNQLLFEVDPNADDLLLQEEEGEPLQRRRIGQIKKGQGDPTRMLRKMALLSGHQTGYKESPRIDFVDERRAQEKQERMKKALKENRAIGAFPDDNRDRPRKAYATTREEAARGVGKPVPFELKLIAARLGADPTEMMYPVHMRELTNAQLTHVIKHIKRANRVDTNEGITHSLARIWNYVVPQLDPMAQLRQSQPVLTLEHVLKDGKPRVIRKPLSAPSNVRTIPMPIYRREDSDLQVDLTGIYGPDTVKAPDNPALELSADFMRRAEAGENVGKITKCKVSGDSLIYRTHGRLKSWQIGPNLNGMSLRMARMMVNAAAIVAGLVPGTIKDAPEEVYKIAEDGDEWCRLAVMTSNPRFKKEAADILMLRDSWYFWLDEVEVAENQRNLKRWAERLRPFLRRN